MAELPEKIIVLGQEFTVKLSPDMMEGDYGNCLGMEYLIKISDKLSPEIAAQTLFHEAIHAAFYVSGIAEIVTNKQEEAIVVMIENAFRHIIDIQKLTKP